MRLSPLASLGIGLAAISLALTGCATAEPEAAPAASSTPTPTPTPTMEPIVIGPAEMPPVVFDGDCEKVATTEELTDTIGVELEPHVRESEFDATLTLGGLSCEWNGPNGELIFVGVIPQTGLDGAEIPADLAEFYFGECTWAGGSCSWQGSNESVWVGISFSGISGMTHDAAVGWGDELGQRVLENHAAEAAESWVRDRAGWWPALDCGTIADAVGAQLGAPLVGEPYGFEHVPVPGQLLAIQAVGHADCSLDGPDGEPVVRVSTWPGLGASFSVPDAEPVDSGVPGISMLDYGANEWGGTAREYRLTDGVNRAGVSASDSSVGTQQEIAAAVAAAAASDFQ